MSAAGEHEEWQDRAACRGPQSVVFYPPPRSERRNEKAEREARAKAICGQCTVVELCLDHALTARELHGIWGGRNELERRRLLADAERMASPWSQPYLPLRGAN